MYILTVLLHKKWDGHKLQTDEMSRHRHYCSEVSFRRKKDLRCTAHTTISLTSQIMLKEKKKSEGGVYHLQQRKINELKTLQKKWLGDCSQYSHSYRLNWPWFRQHIPFSTGSICTKKKVNIFWETSYLKSFHQEREIWSDVFQSPNTAITIFYCTTGQSDPLRATVVAIWYQEMVHTLHKWGGWRKGNISVLAFSSSLWVLHRSVSLHHEPLLLMFCQHHRIAQKGKIEKKNSPPEDIQSPFEPQMSLHMCDTGLPCPNRGISLVSCSAGDALCHILFKKTRRVGSNSSLGCYIFFFFFFLF